MHVNKPSAGLPVVNAQNLTDQLLAAKQTRNAKPSREFHPLPAPRPTPELPSINSVTEDQIKGIADAAQSDDGITKSDSKSQDSLQSLLDAWDTDDARFDLNSDGTVNVFDLFQMLAEHAKKPQGPTDLVSETPNNTSEPPVTRPDAVDTKAGNQVDSVGNTEVAAVPEETTNDEPAALSVDGLMGAWNTNSAQYDLNNDGTVDVQDLFQLLASLNENQSGQKSEKVAASGSYDLIDSLAPRRTPAEHRLTEHKLNRIGDRLAQRLHDAGFVDHPPSNVSDILNHMTLNDDQKQTVLSRISQHYPEGLGVSMIG